MSPVPASQLSARFLPMQCCTVVSVKLPTHLLGGVFLDWCGASTSLLLLGPLGPQAAAINVFLAHGTSD